MLIGLNLVSFYVITPPSKESRPPLQKNYVKLPNASAKLARHYSTQHLRAWMACAKVAQPQAYGEHTIEYSTINCKYGWDC